MGSSTIQEIEQENEVDEDFQTEDRSLVATENKPRTLPKREAIPESVLRQFDAHIHLMKPAVMLPLALLVRTTGWRLSEILDLRIDTCLDRDKYGWWLSSHWKDKRRIPITDEVAQTVELQRQRASENFTRNVSPTHHLFVSNGKGGGTQGNYSMGNRIVKEQVRVALIRLVQQCNIVDDDERLYHITAGSLRRAKYLEMIHLGVDLLSIQHWMGDDSIFTALNFAERQRDQAYELWVPKELRSALSSTEEQNCIKEQQDC